MKARLTLLISWALVAVLGVTLWQSQSAQSTQQRNVEALSRQQAELRYELKVARQKTGELTQQATQLDQQLGSAKARTTATQQALADREQREISLMHELTTLRQMAPPVPLNPVADQAIKKRVQALESQLLDLLTRALADSPPPPAIPARHVVRLDPQSAFVAVDYGSSHGAQTGEIISLQRGTSILAQAQISHAGPLFSIAQIQPTSVKGQLQTGDKVVFNK